MHKLFCLIKKIIDVIFSIILFALMIIFGLLAICAYILIAYKTISWGYGVCFNLFHWLLFWFILVPGTLCVLASIPAWILFYFAAKCLDKGYYLFTYSPDWNNNKNTEKLDDLNTMQTDHIEKRLSAYK